MNTLREYVTTPGRPAAASPASRTARGRAEFRGRRRGSQQDLGLDRVERFAVAGAAQRTPQARLRRSGRRHALSLRRRSRNQAASGSPAAAGWTPRADPTPQRGVPPRAAGHPAHREHTRLPSRTEPGLTPVGPTGSEARPPGCSERRPAGPWGSSEKRCSAPPGQREAPRRPHRGSRRRAARPYRGDGAITR